MSYHRFNNLREMFQGHLNRVLMKKNVELEDYRDRPCNCQGRGCHYGNVCCKALIVYKVTIPRTGKNYIGATLQALKKRRKGRVVFWYFFQSGNWVRIRPHIQLQGSSSGCGA
jgi:hypothetical protein